MADIPKYLPADPNNWGVVRGGPNGQTQFLMENPAFSAAELQKAMAERQYLNDLMSRQSGVTLNPALVGKGASPDNSLWGSMQPLMRDISQATIGQPYGFLTPPTTGDVGAADQKVTSARGEDDRIRRMAEILMNGKR